MRSLLLVDDDPAIRRIAQLSLERSAGWSVRVACDGEEAKRLALESVPEVILLDVMMPGQDGPQTLSELRADPRTEGIPIVFLTAKVLPNEIARLEVLGAIGVIRKPFDPLALSAQLEALLSAAGDA